MANLPAASSTSGVDQFHQWWTRLHRWTSVQEAESWLQARGAVKLHLMVRNGNLTRTLGMHQKVGYKRC